MPVVPEFMCTNVGISTSYFVDVLEFTVKYERPEERFVYLTCGGVNLMLEGICPSESELQKLSTFQWKHKNTYVVIN